MQIRIPACLAATVLAVSTLHAQQLSKPEQVMVEYIHANEQASNDLLKQLVEINSGTRNLEGVRAVGKIITAQLDELGFQTKWIPMDEVKRAGTLVAEHPCPEPGKCGKRMLLIGHIDTVFEKDSPFQSYTVKGNGNGNIATGPGVNDMKGGLVIMLYALKAMQAAGVLKQTD